MDMYSLFLHFPKWRHLKVLQQVSCNPAQDQPSTAKGLEVGHQKQHILYILIKIRRIKDSDEESLKEKATDTWETHSGGVRVGRSFFLSKLEKMHVIRLTFFRCVFVC